MSQNDEDEDWQVVNGERVNCRPKSLYPKKEDDLEVVGSMEGRMFADSRQKEEEEKGSNKLGGA